MAFRNLLCGLKQGGEGREEGEGGGGVGGNLNLGPAEGTILNTPIVVEDSSNFFQDSIPGFFAERVQFDVALIAGPGG